MINFIFFHINTVNTCKRLSSGGLPVHVIPGLLFFSLFFLFTGCIMHKYPISAEGDAQSPASQIIHLYQGPLNHLSAVRHGGCPMHPNCSAYGLAAIEKHGALVGWMMAFDRLMRCGLDETLLSPEVLVDGSWKYVDTLEHNDFWWCSADENTTFINTQPSDQSLDWGISVE